MDWVKFLRVKRSLVKSKLEPGSLPSHTLPSELDFKTLFLGGPIFALMAWYLTIVVLKNFQIDHAAQENIASIVGLITLWVIWLYPWIVVFVTALFYWQVPCFQEFKNYSVAQHALCCLVFGGFIAWFILKMLTFTSHYWHQPMLLQDPISFSPGWLAIILTCLSTTFILMTITGSPTELSVPQKQLSLIKIKSKQNKDLPFGLWLGESTGTLAKLWHQASLKSHQPVILSLEDATQNILILGAIGSGKTTAAMHPLLLQLLDQNCGGLIFDIKGDFHQAVNQAATLTGRSYQTIGPGLTKVNLLFGLSPELAASFLKSAFLLNSNHQSDGFWIDTATELCRNILGILLYTRHYHLQGLYRYLFEPNFQKEQWDEIQLLISELDIKQQRLFASYHQYHTQVFNQFDEKVKSGVLATIAQILSPFNHPDLVDTFCTRDLERNFQIERVLEGELYLISLPLATWGLGAKVIYTLIKLRFFNLMQQRTLHLDWDQQRPVFFMCDEYQEIVSANKDGLSDLNFWDKSRSSKTIGIISAQSIASFQAALGNIVTAQALLQNFRQKICFKVEDESTVQTFKQLLGMAETVQCSKTYTAGSSSSSHDQSNHKSQGTTLTPQQKTVLDGQIFRSLSPFEAVALLTVKGYGADDILKMQPIYF